MTALDDLARRVHHELECTGYPARDWVPPRTLDGAPVRDAVIVGGGQNGIAIAFRLLRERVTNIAVLDKRPLDQEGPWPNFARMLTLRTLKTASGPELGIPSLAFRAWYDAKFGDGAWDALGKIDRRHWHEYLIWLRRTLGIPVTSQAEVTDIEPLANGLLAVHAQIAGQPERILTRNVVLATGIEGSGRWAVPPLIAASLPPDRYAHTKAAIDFAALAGKRVAVIGAGASAFDNAALALQAGAARVDMFVRRPALQQTNPNRWIEFTGFLRHFADLDDARKWQFMQAYFALNQPPPQDSFDRCASYPNFALHLASPVHAAELAADAIHLTTPAGVSEADYLIVATGFILDLAARPELQRFRSHIALWSDRYQPPPGQESASMSAYPYLTGAFQFTEKTPGAAPYLKHIYNNTYGAMISLGGAAGIPQVKFTTERITAEITRQLFLDHADEFLASLRAYASQDLDMASYAASRR